MSEAVAKRHHDLTYESTHEEVEHVSSWTGWVAFAGFMMIITGALQLIYGIVGLFRSSFYLVSNTSSQLLVFNNVKTWAWASLIAGAIILMAGLSIFSGSTWSRIIAVLIAMSAIAFNLVSMPLYPIWSVIVITISVLVIYAVVVHGGDLAQE